MKKKFLVLAMSLVMVTSILAGCGKTDNDATTETNDNAQETMEETLDEFSETVGNTEDSTSSEVIDEKKDDSKVDENGKEDNDNESAVLDREYDAEDIAMSIDPEHFGMSISAEGLTMSVANSNGNMMMSYSVFMPADVMQTAIESEGLVGNYDMDKINADGGITLESAVYQIDGESYCYSNAMGTAEYFKISDSDSETTQSFFTDVPNSEEMGIDTASIGNVEYIETIVYNDIYVDVVRVTGVSDANSEIEPETFDMYIDPETGRATAMVMHEVDEMGNDMIIDITVSDIELPAEFEGCGEDTSTKAAEYLFGVMMLPMYLAQ